MNWKFRKAARQAGNNFLNALKRTRVTRDWAQRRMELARNTAQHPEAEAALCWIAGR
jgi:hypothetical protein